MTAIQNIDTILIITLVISLIILLILNLISTIVLEKHNLKHYSMFGIYGFLNYQFLKLKIKEDKNAKVLYLSIIYLMRFILLIILYFLIRVVVELI